jgi:hypothetical protein
MKISTKPVFPEEYVVKYWYKDEVSGFHKQSTLSLYTSSKSAHKKIEKFALKILNKLSDVTIVNVTYQ